MKYQTKGLITRRQRPITTCVVGVIYANWCPHCKTLVGDSEAVGDPEAAYKQSDWFRVKQMLDKVNDKGTIYEVEKIESAQEKEIRAVQNMGVKANGFPTIYKYYKRPGSNSGEKVEHYMGNRTPEDIVKWARKHSGRFGSNFKIYGGSRRRSRTSRTRRFRISAYTRRR